MAISPILPGHRFKSTEELKAALKLRSNLFVGIYRRLGEAELIKVIIEEKS
jgi:hypothetical protein